MQDKLNNLRQFMANNYDLEMLEGKLNEFNPFKVLKVDQYEIRHSNIISWLLDPQENHNLSDKFVKKFLTEIILNNDNLETSLTIFDAQEIPYQDFEIRREWNDIDVFIVSQFNKLAIIIENKVHGSESKGQLKTYYNSVSSEYKDYQIIPVLLSLDGTQPSDSRYGAISYIQILKMLKFITSIQKENLSPKVFDFIGYYLRTLEILTMEDDKIKSLCKKIYKEHKQALDLIYEYAEDTDFEESAKEFIKMKGFSTEDKWIDGRGASFLPNHIKQLLHKVGSESWHSDYPVIFWYTMVHDEKLGIILEVGPFKDPSLRHQFLNHLKKHDFDIRERSFKPGAKYTRIFTKYIKFDDWDNKESIIEKMDYLFKISAKKATINLEKACVSFEWDPLDG